MKTPEIGTERMVLQPLRLEDAERTQELFPHWEIVRHLADSVPWPYPANGARRFYEEVCLPKVERGEEWAWTLRLREAPEEHIGTISVFPGDEENRGFWLGLPWQGRGLMTEAVEAVNAFWFGELGFEVLRSPKAAANVASRRISERTGMRLVRTFAKAFVCGVETAELWELTREEWMLRR